MIGKDVIEDFGDEMTDHGWTPFKFRRGWEKWVLTSTPFNLDGIIQWLIEIEDIENVRGVTIKRISPTLAHIIPHYSATLEQFRKMKRESRLRVYDPAVIYGCIKVKQKENRSECFFESGKFMMSNLSAIIKSASVHFNIPGNDIVVGMGPDFIEFSRFVPDNREERPAETI